MTSTKHTADVIVIGGGNIGSAVAYGIARTGTSVAVLDEGDIALRAARGNFGLVWFHGKGLGMQRYVDWCLEATQKWPAFAAALEHQSGIGIDYEKRGGLYLCRSGAEYAERVQKIDQLRRQAGGGYDCELMGRGELQSMMPRMKLGPNIVGASFSRHDGAVNPLFLLRALHTALKRAGGRYFPGHAVTDIQPVGRAFTVQTPGGRFCAPKLVIAAGVGTPRLAAMLGVRVPVRPQRGQLLVTERIAPVLPYPISGIRQTREGSFLLGVSNEEVGFDTGVSVDVLRTIAGRAMEAFPTLANVRVLRSWAALRPLSPDNYPIYQESASSPGAFVVTSHSGVSLASLYETHVARWIVDGTRPEGFEQFDLRRFDVQAPVPARH